MLWSRKIWLLHSENDFVLCEWLIVQNIYKIHTISTIMTRKDICYNSFTTCSRNSDRKILFLLFLFIFTQEKENYYAKKQVSGSYFYLHFMNWLLWDRLLLSWISFYMDILQRRLLLESSIRQRQNNMKSFLLFHRLRYVWCARPWVWQRQCYSAMREVNLLQCGFKRRHWISLWHFSGRYFLRDR